MLDQPLLLEPLLRLMPLPSTLARHAPLSSEKRLYSVALSDLPFVQASGLSFDETCWLTVMEGMDPASLPLKLSSGGSRKRFSGVHLAVLSNKAQARLVIGDDHTKVFIGSGAQVRAMIQLHGQATVFIGDGTTIGQARLLVRQADLVIGADCQVLEDAVIQCNDPHPIIDLSNGQLINDGRRRVYVGRHVLINRRAVLCPGVRVGDGAIIQTGAVVVHDVPPNTWVGGSPAVVMREQVAWERDTRRAVQASRTQRLG